MAGSASAGPGSAGAGAEFVRATPADRETLAGLMREFYAYEGLAWDAARAYGALDEVLGDGRLGEVWLVRRGDDVAGYFFLGFGYSLEFGGRFALLDELFLREPHRGGGLGRAAIAQAESRCRALGMQALRLEVEHHNTLAQGFYGRLGFETHERYLLTRWVSEDG